MLVETTHKNGADFKSKINKAIVIPVFLIFGFLILLIQIFSISITGVVFFILMIILLAMDSVGFNKLSSRIYIIFIQVLTVLIIFANFITTSNLLQES